ncbi:Uncharacterised protein [Klebsiella pneumoniae]|nr:Uncharacterised protein [Klebsiella pneumoniae]
MRFQGGLPARVGQVGAASRRITLTVLVEQYPAYLAVPTIVAGVGQTNEELVGNIGARQIEQTGDATVLPELVETVTCNGTIDIAYVLEVDLQITHVKTLQRLHRHGAGSLHADVIGLVDIRVVERYRQSTVALRIHYTFDGGRIPELGGRPRIGGKGGAVPGGQADVADPVEVTRQGAGHLVATGETKHGSTRLVEHIRIDAEPYGAQTRIVGTIIIGVIATDGHRGIEGAILIVQVQRMQDAILPILVGVENVPVNRGQRSENGQGRCRIVIRRVAGIGASGGIELCGNRDLETQFVQRVVLQAHFRIPGSSHEGGIALKRSAHVGDLGRLAVLAARLAEVEEHHVAAGRGLLDHVGTRLVEAQLKRVVGGASAAGDDEAATRSQGADLDLVGGHGLGEAHDGTTKGQLDGVARSGISSLHWIDGVGNAG